VSGKRGLGKGKGHGRRFKVKRRVRVRRKVEVPKGESEKDGEEEASGEEERLESEEGEQEAESELGPEVVRVSTGLFVSEIESVPLSAPKALPPSHPSSPSLSASPHTTAKIPRNSTNDSGTDKRYCCHSTEPAEAWP